MVLNFFDRLILESFVLMDDFMLALFPGVGDFITEIINLVTTILGVVPRAKLFMSYVYYFINPAYFIPLVLIIVGLWVFRSVMSIIHLIP